MLFLHVQIDKRDREVVGNAAIFEGPSMSWLVLSEGKRVKSSERHRKVIPSEKHRRNAD